MSSHKYFDRICAVIILIALVITVLFMNGEALGIQKIVDADAERNSDSGYFTDNDLNGDWTGYQVRTITLNGDSAKISGTGAYEEYGDIYITQSGYYEISGELSDGSIIVDAKNYSKVWIRLDGVTVNSGDNACLIVENADKVFLTLADASENIFTSGNQYSGEAVENGINAVIYAKDDLTVNGSGSLTVSGGWKHGIKANDDLVITGGVIRVTADGDAIHVNDSFRITGAALDLTAGDEGIDVDGDEEETAGSESGYLYIESGTISIDAQGDGIHAAGDITIDGGEITLHTGKDEIQSDTLYVNHNGNIIIR